MIRFTTLLSIVVTCAMLAVSANAADATKKLNADQRKALEAKIEQHEAAAMKAYQTGSYSEAASAFQELLDMTRQLYPKKDYPDGHEDVASGLNNLAFMFRAQGKLAEAEVLLRKALGMTKRLTKGDDLGLARSLNSLGVLLNAQGKLVDAEHHLRDALDMRRRLIDGDDPTLATNLNNLGYLYDDQGKYAEAELIYREALEMNRRLFKGDHHSVALCLNNLAALLRKQGKLPEASQFFREALDMTKRLFKGDHPRVALSLNNMAYLYEAQGKLADAERLQREALDMRKRLFKGDHPHLANSMNNLALILKAEGKTNDAARLLRDALAMNKRLYPKQDHPAVALSINNLAGLFFAQGEYASAAPLYRDALAMTRRFAANFAGQKSEGEALNLIASLPLVRDGFLTNNLKLDARPDAVYTEVWSDKGFVARVYERRQQAARAAATDPKAATLLAELADARRRRAALILAPKTKDPIARQKREDDIENLDKTISELDRNIRPLLPIIERSEKLVKAIPADLQKVLSADSAIVDFLRYNFHEFDEEKQGTFREHRIECYLAFVVTKEKVAWIDLGPAAPIEDAIDLWRRSIIGGKEIPTAIAGRVGELVWAKVRKTLPDGTKTVYISPDMALSRIPWGALPGDKSGTILLEDFAIATIPHAPFLLDKLWPRDPNQEPLTRALVVGGVKYDRDLNAPPREPVSLASRGTPLLKPDQKLGWSFLDGTLGEANGVASAAVRQKLSVTQFGGDKATTTAILEALPAAKVAHFATHGFFADASFRAVFQLDETDYEKTRRGERIGRAVNNPLVMTGLVLAGANDPMTPGRGIVTGESLIDLDLSGLELAVLSACETGLGDVAGGEGVFGLQRAFHYAGTRNVVATLWKVPDEPTAALMALFYRNLWEKDLSPLESLRQAQLEVYRNPTKIAEHAKEFRGKFKEVSGSGSGVQVKPTNQGKAHPLFWAAFNISGPGHCRITNH